MGIICGDKILPKYMLYMLEHINISNWASLANPPSISREAVLDQKIPLPSLEVQKRIVNELDGYIQIVNSAQRIIKNYFPTLPVNNNWGAVKLRELFEVVTDLIDPQSCDGSVNYIGLENIESNTGKLIGQIECSYQNIKSTKRKFSKGDVLYGKLRPSLNKVVFATIDGICSTDIIVLRPKLKTVIPEFYSILLRNSDFNTMVLNGCSGGQLPRVDVDYLLNLPIPQVPVEEQQLLLDQIQNEKKMIEPSVQIIDTFSKKIKQRTSEIWGD